MAEVYRNLVIVVTLVMEGVAWVALCHLQCLKDMPCMTLGESPGVFRCCNDSDYRGSNRIGVRDSDEKTERVILSLSVQGTSNGEA